MKQIQQSTQLTSVLQEQLFDVELNARTWAVERSKLTNKFVYLIQRANDWMVHTHGVLRVGDKLVATYKLGEKCL